MNLTTYTFRQQTQRTALAWTEEPSREDPELRWALWESACGNYRVMYDATLDDFAPQLIRQLANMHREWVACAPHCRTLHEAQAACEGVHCA